MLYKEKAYTRINWKNRPNLSTPLGAKNLNKMDATINELDDRILEVSSEVEKDSLNIVLMSGELNTLKEDVDENTSQINELSSLAEDVNGLKIVNTASGTTAYMDDASNMNIENIVFYGESKQISQDILFSPSVVFAPLTESGITVTPVANNGFKISGTNTSTNSSVYYDLYYSKTDMLCSETFVFDTGVPDGTIDYMYYEYLNGGGSNMRLNTSARTSTIRPNLGIVGQQIRLYIPKGKTINTTIYPTVKPVNPNPDYPQMIEPSSVGSVSVYRKNLMQNTATTMTKDGITYTVNDDGSVTANGTNTSASETYFVVLGGNKGRKEFLGKEIILSGCPNGGGANKYYLQFYHYDKNNNNALDYGSGAKLIFTNDTADFNVSIIVKSGVTMNNVKFYPMIRPSFFTDATYEPYQTQFASLTSSMYFLDGIGDLKNYIDIERGVLVEKVKNVTFDGSNDEGWATMDTQVTGVKRMYTTKIPVKPVANNSTIPNMLCSHYKAVSPVDTFTQKEGITNSIMASDGRIYLYVYDENFNTADISLWKAHLQANPMTVVYELETPTETTIPTAELNELRAMLKLHTYKPNTIVDAQDTLIDVQYVADTRLYVDKKIESLANSILSMVN